MRQGLRSSLAALCLLAFLAQAGDGLMAMVCPPGMEMEAVSWVTHGVSGGADRLHGSTVHSAGEHPLEADSEGHGCPFGPGPMAFCGGPTSVASLVAPSLVVGPVVSATTPDVGRAPSTLFPFQLFRPPRV